MLPENISVTGTYTVRPTLRVHGETYELEPVTFPVTSNRVEVVSGTMQPSEPLTIR